MKHSVHSREYKKFRERLKQARIELDLSQTEVADRIGQLQAYVSKCEKGERRVDVIELLEFATVYGKGVDFFVSNIDLSNVADKTPMRKRVKVRRKKQPKDL